MKFLYLCPDHGIPVLGTKGASVHVREFVTALMHQGHSVSLVCAKRGHGNETGFLSIREVAPQEIPGEREAYLARLHAQSPSLVSSQNDLVANPLLAAEIKKLEYNAQLEPELERIVSEIEPDVLYERYSLFAHAGTSIAFKYRLPHILEVNAPLIQERQSTLGMVLVQTAQEIEDLVFRQADAVIAVSSNLRDHVVERGVQPRFVSVIPNGVDLAKFNPEIRKENHGITAFQSEGLPPSLAQKTVIGFVGSLKPWHGVDVLIEAFARARHTHPDLSLLIVGEGPQLEELRTEARRDALSDHVHFAGAVPHREIPKYIALMDITVAPYRRQSRFYFSPLKILEYMAMGKPVIATRQGQITELIQHEINGLVCEPESVESLSDALIRLAGDHGLRQRLGMSAADTVASNHSWTQVASSVAALAESLLPFGSSRLLPFTGGAVPRATLRSEK